MTTPHGSVRVRFAPSPTGYLHVGGARTAIFNWVFARHAGGTFVLRIEDTDVDRSTRDSERAVIDDLTWLGLEWDEGPDRGGDNGPYRQSQRLDAYRRVVDDLLARKLAYPCFCTDEELERKRREAIERGRPPQYDGTCRHLTPDQVAQRRAQGLAESVRFQVPPELIGFDDVVRGPMDFATSTVGDFVILRSNGLPTYNFAAAVDDHLMRITHVIRGEEHLPNTVRQMLVYEALGADPPVFAHVPLILGEDRAKLSKRHGASSISELRAQGFLPTATLNYLLLLGWSHPEGSEVLSLDEIVAAFTLERIGKAPAVFDRRKLAWMNGQHIRRYDFDHFLPLALPFLPAAVTERYDEMEQRRIVAVLQDSIETLADLPARAEVFLDEGGPDSDAAAVLADAGARGVVEAMAAALASGSGPLSPEDFKASARAVGRDLGVKGRDLYMPVRAAVTGSIHGPDLSHVVSIIGREAVVGRLRRAVAS